MTGTILAAPNLPGWINVPLRNLVSARFGKRTFLGNDANLAGLAEAIYGEGLKVECPTGSGNYMTIKEVSEELTRRLARIFLRGPDGSGPVWELFFAALDAGWHVSPMLNQDNHLEDWGTASDARSWFFMADSVRSRLNF